MKQMIVKVYNTKRVKNRLVTYMKVNENDFERVQQGTSSRYYLRPNEHFYRKFRKATTHGWLDEFAWKILDENEIKELISSYDRKMTFYANQLNKLRILSDDLVIS